MMYVTNTYLKLNKMQLLVLPVSGGGFVVQLAQIQRLCEVDYHPDVTLASSGGNVSAYIAAAADWKWSGVERIASQLDQGLFVRPWSSFSPLSFAMGFFRGNIYTQGIGAYHFLQEQFTPRSILKYEIWTGTYNEKRQRSRLFCNRREEDALLKVSHVNPDLTQSMEPVFMNGDLQMISIAAMASASVPAIVPGQVIEGETYIDGGIAGASPLTILSEAVLATARRREKLHLTYLNSLDLNTPKRLPIFNVVDTLRRATSDLVRSQTVIDRLAAYSLLQRQRGEILANEFPCTLENLRRVQGIRELVQYSLLELYPGQDYDIDMTSFNGRVVVNGMHRAYQDCHCRLWWIPNVHEATVNSLIEQYAWSSTPTLEEE